jgi:pantothenate synthetase
MTLNDLLIRAKKFSRNTSLTPHGKRVAEEYIRSLVHAHRNRGKHTEEVTEIIATLRKRLRTNHTLMDYSKKKKS